MTKKWAEADQEEALRQGWGVWSVWDQDKRREELVIQRYDAQTAFDSDETARRFVALQAYEGDEMCQRAITAVLTSKIPGGMKC